MHFYFAIFVFTSTFFVAVMYKILEAKFLGQLVLYGEYCQTVEFTMEKRKMCNNILKQQSVAVISNYL